MNKVILIGRLSKDNELKYTQSNKEVLNNTIAVNRSYYDSQGERQADFINIVVWNERAKLLDKYTKKGDRIAVVGELQTRMYQNDKGDNVYITEVVVSEIEFLEPKKEVPFPEAKKRDTKKEIAESRERTFNKGDIIDLSGDEPF